MGQAHLYLDQRIRIFPPTGTSSNSEKTIPSGSDSAAQTEKSEFWSSALALLNIGPALAGIPGLWYNRATDVGDEV
jgi:hypothetical protein